MSDVDVLLGALQRNPSKAREALDKFAEARVQRSAAALLGEVVGLMLASDLHRRWPIALIEKFVLPAFHHHQFRLYRDGPKPIGYISWALLSQEVEDRYLAGGYLLTPQDWKSGELPWLIDFIVPYGHVKQVRRAFYQERIFGDRPHKVIRVPKKPGEGQFVMQFGTHEARRKYPWRSRKINVGPPDSAVEQSIERQRK